MKSNKYLMALTAMGLALATQANATITFNFLENGNNKHLLSTTNFTESGVTLTASGFRTNGAAADLYSKYTSGDPGETGLGMNTDLGNDHEIDVQHFIQLTLPTTPVYSLTSIMLGSVQNGESAKIYWTTTSGTLTGATLLDTIMNADGSFVIPFAYSASGYLDITAGAANVLLESATFDVTPTQYSGVPEPSTYVAGALMLLPFGYSTIRAMRNRKQTA